MNALIGLGRYIFAIPFAVFSIFHFMYADAMAGMAPGGAIMVYVSGAAMLMAAIAIFIGKYDKLACVLLALLLLLYILLVHAKGLPDQGPMSSLLKDLGLLGGALMAASQARDKSVIG